MTKLQVKVPASTVSPEGEKEMVPAKPGAAATNPKEGVPVLSTSAKEIVPDTVTVPPSSASAFSLAVTLTTPSVAPGTVPVTVGSSFTPSMLMVILVSSNAPCGSVARRVVVMIGSSIARRLLMPASSGSKL